MRTQYEIVPLPKEQWQGTIIPMRYTTYKYIDVVIQENEAGAEIKFEEKLLNEPISHYPEEYDFPDKLYQEHWEKAYAWGVLNNGELIGCIETCPEEWSNRLMITELWVHEDFRRKGIAHQLMAVAKEQARLERRRAIILETQSCNVGAISFYKAEGFQIIGFDTCCYSNNDIERKEVRLDLGIIVEKKSKLSKNEIEIREETEEDYFAVEEMTMHAFWNKHQRGCDEHYLVHKLRTSDDYISELSRIAVKDGKVIGAIFYSKAQLKNGNETKEILTFGPLCVAPEFQGRGVGGILLDETLSAAKDIGYEGVVIFGEPDYYPLHGFVTCDQLGITTADGKNFDAFMGYELVPNALKSFGGSFHETDVFFELPKDKVDEYTTKFSPLKKQSFPMQWA